MPALILLAGAMALAAQEPARPAPTVGDTIWVRRAVRVPPRATARAADWELSGDVELLGRPELTLRGDSAIVRYPLVAWKPGTHSVQMPSPTLLAADGSVDSMPPVTVTFRVNSVLPDTPATALRPQPAAGLVARRTVSLLPPVLLGLAVIASLLPLHWWWRRRGKALPPPAPPGPAPVPIERWADAGEARSVLALAASRVRAAIAHQEPDAHERLDTQSCLALLRERRPNWPVDAIGSLLAALDTARFAPGTRDDASRLYREADAMATRLNGEAPA